MCALKQQHFLRVSHMNMFELYSHTCLQCNTAVCDRSSVKTTHPRRWFRDNLQLFLVACLNIINLKAFCMNCLRVTDSLYYIHSWFIREYAIIDCLISNLVCVGWRTYGHMNIANCVQCLGN